MEPSSQEILDIVPGTVLFVRIGQNHSLSLLYASPNLGENLGLSFEQIIDDTAPLLNNIPPSDLEQFFTSEAIAQQINSSWQTSFRYSHPNKGTRWINWHGKAARDEHGLFWRCFLSDGTEQRNDQQELLLLQHALNASYDGIFIQDLKKKYFPIVRVNDAACKTLGYTREELLDASPLKFDPYVTGSVFSEENAKKVLSAPCQFSSAHRKQSGEIFPVEMSCTGFTYDDNYYSIVIARDISERKRMEEKIASGAWEFRSLAENSPGFVIRFDTKLRLRYINSKLAKVLNIDANSVIGKTTSEIWPDDRFKALDELKLEVMACGEERMIETDIIGSDGQLRHHQITVVPERDDQGHIIGTLTFGTDVTSIRESEIRLRHFVESRPGMAYTYRLTPNGGCFPYTSSDIKKYFGLNPEDVAEDQTPVYDLTHPEDQPKVLAAIAESAQNMTPFHVEFRICRPDHPERWLDARSIPEPQADGSLLWYGLMLDISERKQSEIRLRMLASVFDSASEGIIITDPDSRILDVNPAFTQISGYRAKDALGMCPNILSAGHHDQTFFQTIWPILQKQGNWTGEVINCRKNGELYTAQLRFVAVHDESGAAKYYIGIFSDITLLKQQEEYLHYIAHHDALTNLPNRLALMERLSRVLKTSDSKQEKVAVLFLDLDGFKPINDNYGHETGDRVLIDIASRLNATLRAGDTFARVGGDEFIAVLTGIASISECEFTAQRLLDTIAQPVEVGDHSLRLSGSIGISLAPDDGTDADTLLRYADQAMYAAKAAGRNQFLFRQSEAVHLSHNNDQMIHDLRLALDKKEISVYYQPIIDMASGLIIKAEALLRWHHPERGMVSPAEFIPVAECSGLIHVLGDFVFKEAARVANTWHKQAGRPVKISVNRSPRQFFSPNGICHWVEHLREQRIPGELLAVEITEGLLLDDRPQVLQQLKQMHAIGMTVSLDDFGTGYSALSYLKKFDLDYLKIDRSFIRDITDDESDLAIVESIIVMAKRLGTKVVAEGVETQAQADLIATAGCDMAQGYLFARPMPEKDFMIFVSDVTPLYED